MSSATHTIETEQLSIGYEAHGPDDVRAWDAVAPALAAAGHRVIVPHLRGFGPTRFPKISTPRTGQPTALAQDAVNLLDALDIKKAVVAGHDWGAGAVYVLAALFPERVERFVAMSSPYMVKVTPGAELDYTQQRFYWPLPDNKWDRSESRPYLVYDRPRCGLPGGSPCPTLIRQFVDGPGFDHLPAFPRVAKHDRHRVGLKACAHDVAQRTMRRQGVPGIERKQFIHEYPPRV